MSGRSIQLDPERHARSGRPRCARAHTTAAFSPEAASIGAREPLHLLGVAAAPTTSQPGWGRVPGTLALIAGAGKRGSHDKRLPGTHFFRPRKIALTRSKQ